MNRLSGTFLIFVAVIAPLLVFATPDSELRLICQKAATECVMPYMIVLMGLFVVLVAVWRDKRKWVRWVTMGIFLLQITAGNGIVSQYAVLSLERPFQEQRSFELEPFDAIVVLGGGTDEARNGYAESSLAGDRVVVAARMYHAGLVKTIYCTGDRIAKLSHDLMSPAEEAEEILVALGVPGGQIKKVGGMNTTLEMTNLREVVEPGQRVGLITSAWHLARAMRLSKTHGLDFVPIPSDFRADNPIDVTPIEFIPAAEDCAMISLVWKEYLAGLVGR